jgi:hypothetical protein
MKIILTKHCQQRREHYDKEDPEVIRNAFIECTKDIDLESLENNIYKLFHNYFCCIFRKNNADKFTIITIRGHKKLLEKNAQHRVKLQLANAAFLSTGGFIIRRYNYLGKIVKCGYIIDIAGTDMRLLQLNSNLKDKYDMNSVKSIPKTGLKFKEDHEIQELVTFNEFEKCWYLNSFDRI